MGWFREGVQPYSDALFLSKWRYANNDICTATQDFGNWRRDGASDERFSQYFAVSSVVSPLLGKL